MENTRNAIVNAIRKNYERKQTFRISEIDFVSDVVADTNTSLRDPLNVKNRDLRTAWNYADSYFDAIKHGFKDLDGIKWNEADRLLLYVLNCVSSQLPIENPVVLRYK